MFLADVRQCVERVRATQPLTHCITNVIVQDITANALLAAGASPIMVTDPEEARELAQIATGVLINVGTFHQPETSEYMRAAVEGCEKADTPWVLDPVGIGVPALAPRTRFIHEIVKHHPVSYTHLTLPTICSV